MTSDLDSRHSSLGDRTRMRAYNREFLFGMVAYFVILVPVMIWGGLDGDSPWRYLWALLPVLPMLWIVVALWRHIQRLDDYQRLLLLRGFAVGFALSMIAALTLGMLAIAGLELMGAGWIVYSVGMAGWCVAAIVSARR